MKKHERIIIMFLPGVLYNNCTIRAFSRYKNGLKIKIKLKNTALQQVKILFSKILHTFCSATPATIHKHINNTIEIVPIYV